MSISRSSIGESAGGIRGVIDDLLSPYPFTRDIGLKHPTRKIYILKTAQVSKLMDAIPSKFGNKEPSMHRDHTDMEDVDCITVHVGGKVTKILFIEETKDL